MPHATSCIACPLSVSAPAGLEHLIQERFAPDAEEEGQLEEPDGPQSRERKALALSRHACLLPYSFFAAAYRARIQLQPAAPMLEPG